MVSVPFHANICVISRNFRINSKKGRDHSTTVTTFQLFCEVIMTHKIIMHHTTYIAITASSFFAIYQM